MCLLKTCCREHDRREARGELLAGSNDGERGLHGDKTRKEEEEDGTGGSIAITSGGGLADEEGD
jgi:hypothetical protein